MNNFISVAKNLTKYCLILASCLYGYAALAGVGTNGYYRIDDSYYLVRNIVVMNCVDNELTIRTNKYIRTHKTGCLEFQNTIRRCWKKNIIICNI